MEDFFGQRLEKCEYENFLMYKFGYDRRWTSGLTFATFRQKS